MKRNLLLPLAAVVLIVVAAPGRGVLAAEDRHHGESGSAVQKLQLNAGKKWATDAALRQSMDDINQAMAKALPLIHKDRFGDSDYAALATTINQKVGYAIEHCKLEAKADTMLHLVLADLMAGAEIMEGKTAAARHDGAVRVRQALESYGKYFQHPNWKVPRG
ncbi:hypothetical protein [Dechloromonas sp. H13]|uniref:hypothetical protein n=1 Tax=Dechloromonas sp. H13 TaxID=2570193 RepID=UPI0012920901|nr:hypothetical protein [Dechloromonas sp. H13]